MPYRVLVVDDEVSVRQLTSRALARDGFTCELAADGDEAEDMARSTHYDVVITDIMMPRQHGHNLAVELLAWKDRPLIVVVTGLIEPRLAKDLLARGVDDILHKPVDYDVLTAKVRALLERHRSEPERRREVQEDQAESERLQESVKPIRGASAITTEDLDEKLGHLAMIRPLSASAIEVIKLTNTNDASAEKIAAAIEVDASLAAEVLKVANSSLYNPSRRQVIDLEEAIVRIGQKRISEIALATTTSAALNLTTPPGIDLNLTWRRSVAAGVAAELLIPHAGIGGDDSGLFLSALMHGLGKVVLATLYPAEYGAMLEACEHTAVSLIEEEQRVFPETHPEVMARLLGIWDVPSRIYEPLQHLAKPYSRADLTEVLRTKVQTAKLAMLIGQIAVGRWQPWDDVELPPASVIKRFGAGSLPGILEQTCTDAEMVSTFGVDRSRECAPSNVAVTTKSPTRQIAYVNLSTAPFDFLKAIVCSMGVQLTERDLTTMSADEGVLINGVDVQTHIATALTGRYDDRRARVLVTNADQIETFGGLGNVLCLPCSYGALRSRCIAASRELPQRSHLMKRQPATCDFLA